MDEMLLLCPGPDPERWEWAVAGLEDGRMRRGGLGPLASIKTEAAGRETILLLPGTDVRLESIEAPPAKGGEVRTAVAYLLEDQVCERVEDLHFAIGRRDPTERLPVAIIRRALLRAWLEPLYQQDIRPSQVISETLALPIAGNGAAITVSGDCLLVRTGEDSGCAVELELAGNNLGILPTPAGGEVSASLPIWPVNGAEMPERLLAGIQAAGWTPDLQTGAESRLALFARGLSSQRPSLNLLQGEFSDRTNTQVKRRWWPAAALILLTFGLHVGWSWWDLHRLAQQRQALQSETETLFRQAFPEVHRIVDMETQAKQQLDALRKQSGGHGEFLQLFNKVATRLRQTPGIQLTGLIFDNGSLDVEMKTSDVKAVDGLAGQLNAEHLSARILSTESRDGRIQARLRVQGDQS